MKDKILGALWGGIVGDALGVPVEFMSRKVLKSDPVTGMRAYGSHNQPAGTWSDDSSLMLCTLVSLHEKGYDPADMMDRFLRWLDQGYMTAHGKFFDIGSATMDAISAYEFTNDPFSCGRTDENSNGNGSLMRIIPLSLYVCEMPTEQIVQRSFDVSALTHGHIRSKLCCAYYSLLVRELINGETFASSVKEVAELIEFYIPDEEFSVFRRILNTSILSVDENDVSSTGYVIHTLEASLWCLHNSSSYREAVLKAVNLGHDTDTVATVTGSLAGLLYGYDSIPSEWIEDLASKKKINKYIKKFKIRK